MTPALAEWMRKLHPLRLQYELLSNANPFAAAIAEAAKAVRENRAPASPENPFAIAEERASRQIEAALDSWGKLRDSMEESVFLSVYGSPAIQAAAGIDPASERELRKAPKSTLHRALIQERIAELKCRIGEGSLLECAIRGLLYAGGARKRVDERGVNALRRMRLSENKPRLTLAQFKALAREQFFMLTLDPEATLDAIPSMLPADMNQRQKAFDAIREVLAASQEVAGETAERLLRVKRLFGLEDEAPEATKTPYAEAPKKVPKTKDTAVPRQTSPAISAIGRNNRHEHH
jgi:hypothetical protein